MAGRLTTGSDERQGQTRSKENLGWTSVLVLCAVGGSLTRERAKRKHETFRVLQRGVAIGKHTNFKVTTS
jgi:hypothetical protein